MNDLRTLLLIGLLLAAGVACAVMHERELAGVCLGSAASLIVPPGNGSGNVPRAALPVAAAILGFLLASGQTCG